MPDKFEKHLWPAGTDVASSATFPRTKRRNNMPLTTRSKKKKRKKKTFCWWVSKCDAGKKKKKEKKTGEKRISQSPAQDTLSTKGWQSGLFRSFGNCSQDFALRTITFEDQKSIGVGLDGGGCTARDGSRWRGVVSLVIHPNPRE